MSLRWLYFAVLAPLVLLAALAWWGTRAQLRAAWAEARDEAQQLAPQLAGELASEIRSSLRSIPNFPVPPQPGPASPREEILDTDHLADLAALRDDPEAGYSASGLPLRALAALRIETLSPGSQPRTMLLRLLTREAPSAITTAALRRLGTDGDVLSEWASDETLRHNARSLPLKEFGITTARTDSFHQTQVDSFDLIRRDRDCIDYLPLQRSSEIVRSARAPLGTGLFTTFAAEAIDWPRPDHAPLAPLLASVPLGSGYPLSLEIRVVPELLEASIRRQQRWTLALLSMAVLTAAGALFTIHRTVSRERRLAGMKAQFVSSVSHELRAPLGSIRLMAEALQQGKVARPAEFHALIAREGARLTHLIENVLDFARIEDGRKRYQFEESDLGALIRDTMALMQPLASDRGVRLESELADLTANVDPAAIQQALVNLLDNAIKFSPEGSRVAVASSRQVEPPSLCITVTDQGPGIPQGDHQSIFERFHRLGNELRRETRGAGIGLSIVRHIAEAHHGTISVTSQPGHGSTFTLTLPDTPCAC